MEPPPVQACLFDMDGLLLNTEDQITTCINIILQKYGKPDLPWSIKARIQGRTAEESDIILLQWAQLPIGHEEYVKELNVLHDRIFPLSVPLPGVTTLLQRLQTLANVDLALATSSSRAKFTTKSAGCVSLFDCFPPECQVMGDDPRVQKHKPAPDIYLCALQCVNERRAGKKSRNAVTARECLVFEDSVQGVEAGNRAGMQVVWCPHEGLLHELLHGNVDDVRSNFYRVFGLDDTETILGLDVTALADRIQSASSGWIRLFSTLENFEFARYGLTAP